MEIEFEAKKVEFNEAVGGDYVQVDFDSEVYPDPNEDQSIYLMISAQYEFPPFKPTVEWYDGKEYGGGADIIEYDLTVENFGHLFKNTSSIGLIFSNKIMEN